MTAGFGPLPLAEDHTQAVLGTTRIRGPRWAHLPTLTIGLLGVQILWSVELSYAPPYLLSLGLTKPGVAMVFLAGPLSGFVMQPIIGALADNSTSRWGRRRPYMLLGCAVCALSMLLLGYTREVATVLTGGTNSMTDRATVWLAVVAIYLVDFSVNAVQAVDRALLVDILPPSLQASGNAWAASMLGLGSLIGFFIGNLDLPTYLPFFGSTELQILSVLVVLLIVIGHLVTAVSVREIVLVRPEHHNPSLLTELRQIWVSMWTLPRTIRQICMIQFFAWLGWFPVLVYTTMYVSDLYVRSVRTEERGPSVGDLDEGTRLGSRALFFSATLTLLTNLLLPIITSATSSSKTTMKGCVPSIPLPTIWMMSHLLFCLCMLATFAVSTIQGATLVIAITGVAWGIAQWAPFALLAEAILTSSTKSELPTALRPTEVDALMGEIDEDATPTNPEPVSTEDDLDRLEMHPDSDNRAVSLEIGLSAQAGVILGIHNVCIVIPQFLVTIFCAVIFAMFENDDGSRNKPNSVVYAFRFGAIWSFVAFAICRRMAREL